MAVYVAPGGTVTVSESVLLEVPTTLLTVSLIV